MEIVLDIDGVLADFISSALDVHDMLHMRDHWPGGTRECEKVIGCTADEFWQPIHRNGVEFWRDLERYPWADSLVELVDTGSEGNWLCCTSPARNYACAQGKALWINNHIGTYTNHFIGSKKHWLANPNRVLIDDNDKNCESFELAGGHAILFPQPWNQLHDFEGDRVEYVRSQLEARIWLID